MIGVTWIGWDGSVWDLRTGPVKMTNAGVLGLGSAKYQEFTQETALLDGQKFKGWRATKRDVLLPILIGQSASAEEWLALDSAWWRTMRPDKPGTLVVTTPDGASRSIVLRFVDDGGMSFDHDPTRNRLSVAVLNMVADDPWWKGKPFTRSFWGGSEDVDFFGGSTHKGPPFYLGAASTIGETDILNPGDLETWPTYYIDGPASTFSIDLNGSPIAGEQLILPDTQLRIETAPDRQVAYLVTGGRLNEAGARVGGVEVNKTTLLEQVAFAPIPPDVPVHLSVALTGTGRISIAGVPRFFRAWG